MKNLRTLFALLGLLMALGTQPLSAQECGSNKLEKYDTTECANQLSILYSYIKQKNYKDAYPSWRYTYCFCPKIDNQQKWTYMGGTQIMVDKLKESKQDKELRNKYYDTLMTVYDYWKENYPADAGIVLAQKGLYTYAYQNDIKEKWHVGKQFFEESIEFLGNESSYQTIEYYLSLLQLMSKYKELDTAVWIDAYFMVSEIIDYNVAKGDSKWIETKEDIDKLMGPVLSCEQLLPVYAKKLEKDLAKEELAKMVVLMERKGCDNSPVYEKAASKLCSIEPSPTCKAALGKLCYQKGDFNCAINYFKEAIALEQDALKKSDYTLSIADCYVKMNNYGSAMNSANDALALNSSNGKAYMLKGSLFAQMAKGCTEFDKSAAYWVVVDMFLRAKSVDASLADQCNSKINTYSQYFPTKQEIFFKTDENGQTLVIGNPYTVKCLGMSTTIRARAEE